MTDVTSDTEAGKAAVGARSAVDDGLVTELVARARDGQGITMPVIVLGLCGGGVTVIIRQRHIIRLLICCVLPRRPGRRTGLWA
jgi:hypothetical protein